MDDPIRRAGQDAARRGEPFSGCPLMQACNMPAHTGAPIRLWLANVASWEAGWKEVSEARLSQIQKRRRLQKSN